MPLHLYVTSLWPLCSHYFLVTALVPPLRDSATPARSRCAVLVLLGACIRGTDKAALAKHVIPLAEAMSDVNVCASEVRACVRARVQV